MKILGIDTATKSFCLAIYDDGKMCEYNLEIGRKLASLLAVTIKRALDAVALRVSDIDYFACGLGPGSFTGMRVGLSTIKGLSWVNKKPIAGISTLDILAQNVKDAARPIVAVVDARRDLIYCSIYERKGKVLKRKTPYMLLTKEELFKKIKANSIILGDALSLYGEAILNKIKGVTLLDKDYWYPKAHNIILLAQERIRQKKLSSPFEIKPIYLYPKECQIKNVKL